MTARMPSPADVIRWFKEAGIDPVFRADTRTGIWTVEPSGRAASSEAPEDAKTAEKIKAIRQR